MPTSIRPKDIPTAASSVAMSTDWFTLDSNTDGTRRGLASDVARSLGQWASQNPTLTKLAPLDSQNKIPNIYLNMTGFSYVNNWDANTNTPALADGVGTVNEAYYVEVPGTANLGSGAQTFAKGDLVAYNTSNQWKKLPGESNVLDGIATVPEARTALDVYSTDEVSAVDQLSPKHGGVYCDGSTSYMDAGKTYTATTGTRDLPLSVFWFGTCPKAKGVEQPLISRWNATPGLEEWTFSLNTLDQISLSISDGTAVPNRIATKDVSELGIEEKNISIGFVMNPTSAPAFRGTDVTFYVGKNEIESVANNQAGYTSMRDTLADLHINRRSTLYTEGSFNGAIIFNCALTPGQVELVSRGILPYEIQRGGDYGNIETLDGTTGAGWSPSQVTLTPDTDNYGDPGNELDDNLLLTVDGNSGAHYTVLGNSITLGRQYRARLKFFIPAANALCDGILVRGSDGQNWYYNASPTINQWNEIEFSFIATSETFRVWMLSAGSTSWQGNSSDEMALNMVDITEEGAYNNYKGDNLITQNDKIYDIGPGKDDLECINCDYVDGMHAGLRRTGGLWTPTVKIGGDDTGITYSAQEGSYRIVDNTIYATCRITLTSKGVNTGAITIAGLPEVAALVTTGSGTVSVPYYVNFSSLTSVMIGRLIPGSDEIELFDSRQQDVTALLNTNLNDDSDFELTIYYVYQ